MYDRRSIYALNKKNPDADGNLICLTCADFTDEAEFRRWKRWSDQDFHAEDKSDVEESDHTTSMDMVPRGRTRYPSVILKPSGRRITGAEAGAADRRGPSFRSG